MEIEIRIPSPGESITEVDLARWLVADGDLVTKDQEIAEIESDKATLPLIAEQAGKIRILVQEGETVAVDTVACTIDTAAKGVPKPDKDKTASRTVQKTMAEKRSVTKDATPAAYSPEDPLRSVRATPLAKKMMEEEGLSVKDVVDGLRKLSAQDVKRVIRDRTEALPAKKKEKSREIREVSMSQLRRKLAARLVAVKNETAMLTTFNEVDMSEVIRLRKEYQERFMEIHGVKLGFMSFFVKASTIALQEFPQVNSYLDDDHIMLPEYVDISIAVQTEKGLMVPVLRNTEALDLANIEKSILDLAEKARKYRLSIEEMTGGTFSITNGGVFGSMLSTPIINPPQSAILGMHNIVERPVAVGGQVEIRPVMYLALSYDHRIVDGRDSVSFLKRIKELIESPQQMILDGRDPERVLLGI